VDLTDQRAGRQQPYASRVVRSTSPSITARTFSPTRPSRRPGSDLLRDHGEALAHLAGRGPIVALRLSRSSGRQLGDQAVDVGDSLMVA
jgi:hypothetical protein